MFITKQLFITDLTAVVGRKEGRKRGEFKEMYGLNYLPSPASQNVTVTDDKRCFRMESWGGPTAIWLRPEKKRKCGHTPGPAAQRRPCQDTAGGSHLHAKEKVLRADPLADVGLG